MSSFYLNKKVKQVFGIKNLVGREGTVVDTFADEKGALHCKVDAGGAYFWCPAQLLQAIE